MKKLICGVLLFAMGCSDTEWAQWSSIGEPAIIICYSGGREIYRGKSTGRLHTEQGSDGWLFKEVGSALLIRVSGDCVIRQQTESSIKLPALPPQDEPRKETNP